MNFGYVPDPDWADVRELLIPALNYASEFTEAEVQADLASGQAQLWIGRDEIVHCAVVTAISPRPGGKVCEIWLMGGRDRHLWMHFLDVIEAAAKDAGCVAIELTGRRGWARLLPDYRFKAVVLKKAL